MAVEFTNPLDSVKVASPCSADWDLMVGNNRQRFCGQCKLNVYNLSGMSQSEAENLIRNAEGNVCARFFKREDGTVITEDCPVGWQAIKNRMSKVWTAVASILITLVSGVGISAFNGQTSKTEVTTQITIKNTNLPEDNTETEPVMGEITMLRNE